MNNSQFEIMKKLKQIMSKKDNLYIGTTQPTDTDILWIKPNTESNTFQMYMYINSSWTEIHGSVSIDTSSLSQNIIPDTASTYEIGSAEKPFKTIYADEARISSNTLYIDGVPVLGSSSDAITVKADPNQGIEVSTTGTGNAKIQSEANTEVISTGTGGNVNIKTTGSGGNINISTLSNLIFTAANIIADGAFSIKDLTISNSLTVNGTTTTVNSTNLAIKDNIIELNKEETGSGVSLGTSGLKIDRGELDPVYILFDESDDSFKVGTQSALLKIATESFVTSAISEIHTHSNLDVLSKLTVDENGDLMYDNIPFSQTAENIALAKYSWNGGLIYSYSCDTFDVEPLFTKLNTPIVTTIVDAMTILIKLSFTESTSSFNLKYYIGDGVFGTQPIKLAVVLKDGTIVKDSGYSVNFPKSTTGTISVNHTESINEYYIRISYNTNPSYPHHIPSLFIEGATIYKEYYISINRIDKTSVPSSITDPTKGQMYFTEDGGIYISTEDGTVIKSGVDAETLTKINEAATVDYVDQKVLEGAGTTTEFATDEEVQTMLNELGLGGE